MDPAPNGGWLRSAACQPAQFPGPGQAMTIARTLSGGFRAGVLTALGPNLGTMVHALAANLGLSAILATPER